VPATKAPAGGKAFPLNPSFRIAAIETFRLSTEPLS